MSKTPDEIKKGLEICNSSMDCNDCPYLSNRFCTPFCKCLRNDDALTLIQQLEARNHAMYNTILSVMHFVDKWLDCPDYDPDADLNGVDAVQRAVKAREIALQAIEQLQAERDALMHWAKGRCDTCAHKDDCVKHDPDPEGYVMRWYDDCDIWEWRGVQKEDGNGKTC